MVEKMHLGYYISVVAAAMLVSLALPTGSAIGNSLSQKTVSLAQAAGAPSADAPSGPRRENGDMVIGAADAPVTVIEYASLTCPHCARFHTETLPKLKSEYIDTGKVKYVFRDFPLDGAALAGSMIAQCAGPERYFSFIDVFFRQQPNWVRGRDNKTVIDGLKRLARLGGMSESQINACLENKQVQDAVLAQRLAGQQEFQVRSTPTLIINGKPHAGALSFEEIEKIIKPLIKS